MIITKATLNDLDGAVHVLNEQRAYLKEAHIPQWQGAYPSIDDFKEDVELDRFYVMKENDEIIGFFALVYPDHNYDYIEGKWLDDTPYIAIHRMAIANAYKGKGIAGKTFDYIKEKYNHIRIDTHEVNKAMNRAILKNDFSYCGVVYMEDKTPRNGYEWIKK